MMASRIARQSLRATVNLARPRAVVAAPRVLQSRTMATQPSPSERASEIINSAPSSPGLVTKTGSILLGTGLTAAAISQELYVVNEETLIAIGFFMLVAAIGQSMKAPYKSWAEGHIEKVRSVLASARSEHTQAVKERIGSVEQMKDVVSITEGLFALSKETAKLENEAFVQKQKVALASELKSVLDSWVRFEQQQTQSEQAELAKTVIENVLKSLKDEKTQKDILLGAVAEVEQLVKSKAI
jgi:F-type H+-transporting ATPase subunit b